MGWYRRLSRGQRITVWAIVALFLFAALGHSQTPTTPTSATVAPVTATVVPALAPTNAAPTVIPANVDPGPAASSGGGSVHMPSIPHPHVHVGTCIGGHHLHVCT